MAQIIKHRRGSISNLKSTTARNAELIIATGSISDLQGPFIFIGSPVGSDEGVAGAFNSVSKLYQGTNAPTISAGTYGSTLDGTPFYASGENKLYILNNSNVGNTTLNLVGNIEGGTVSGLTINNLTGTTATIQNQLNVSGSLNVTGSLYINGTSYTAATSGTSGTSGSNGTDGTSGSNGTDGTSGSNGTDGTSGSNGTDGSSGTSGSNGTDGTSGSNGTDGSSGTSGSNGTDGSSGTSGSNGTDGTSGSNGTDGTSGSNGTDGSSGTSGSNGTDGSSGSNGTDGSSGTSGSNGTDGSSGTSGSNGTDGTSGSNGTDGTSGSNGTDGTSGTGFDTIYNASAGRVVLSDGTTNAATASANISFNNNILDISGSFVRVTGSMYVSGDLVVQGSSSLVNITGSALDIGTNTIILNTATPGVRFGGISVQDSGSNAGVSGSLFWDSINNVWVYQQPSGSLEGYGSARLIAGPQNTGSLGQEIGLTTNYIQKAVGEDHIGDSNISDSGTRVTVHVDTDITGSIRVTGDVIINGTSYNAATSGTSGSNGTDGSSGTSGSNGTDGTSGSNGTDGSSGTSGSNGTDGTSGSNGTDGSSGTSGSNGTDGSSGTSGSNGTDGTSGSNGTDGTSGSNGTDGSSGSNGTDGTSGSNGTDGTSGTSVSVTGTNNYISKFDSTGATITLVDSSIQDNGTLVTINSDVTIEGILTARELHLDYVTSSVLYTSGSNKFGDTLDDTHQFTGSVNITGSISLNGQPIGTGKLDETVFNAYTSSVTSSFAGTSSYATSASYAVYAENAVIVSGQTKTLTVGSASTTWSFTHNLGYKFPAINVFDSSDKVVIPTEIEVIDSNNLKVYFNEAQTGTVIATVGGNGSSGTSGSNGTDGSSGSNGTDGSSGTSGSNGTDGSSGTSGSNGTDGTSGSNGTDGTSGSNGTDGTSGSNGTDGSSGTSGSNGTDGSSGSNGTDGSSGTSGSNGTDGSSGSNGTDGTSGSNGTDGSSGTSGDSIFAQTGSFWATTNNVEITGSLSTFDVSSSFKIVGNSFGQTSLQSPNGALILGPGYGGVQINGIYPDLTVNGNIVGGTVSGSFTGSGAGLYNIPASGVTGLELNKIVSGSVSASIASDGTFRVNGDTYINGTITAKELHIDYVTSSVLYTSGSTKFGDTLDDTHQFTGSVYITGSRLEISGGDLVINGTSYTAATSGTSGSNGTDGTSGSNGTDGTSGSSGSNGTDGTSGSNGTDGTSGSNGTDGSSGSNGTDGSSGTSGSNGTDGSSGTSGVDGLSGTSGSSGSSGSNGTDGTSGSNGTDGSSGSNGTDGSSGSNGTDGSSGSNGTDGTSGSSGSNGTDGSSGTSGSNGTDGSSGTSGSNGTDGSSGSNGTDGSSGSNGTDGSSGTSGSNGTDGSSGSNGTDGTSGSNGTDGSSGTSGSNGTDGTSGSNGTDGTSGSNGTDGTSGTSVSVTGTNNYIGKFDSTGATITLVDSSVVDDGTKVTVNSNLNVTGNTIITGSLTVSSGSATMLGGDLYVSGNLQILGSSTNVNLQSNTVEIGDNIILVNAYSPFQRYAGISAFDSGSVGFSGSILWDSETDTWLTNGSRLNKIVGVQGNNSGGTNSLTQWYFPRATSDGYNVENGMLRETNTGNLVFGDNGDKFKVESMSGDIVTTGSLTFRGDYGLATDSGSLNAQVTFRDDVSKKVGLVSNFTSSVAVGSMLGYKTSDGSLTFTDTIDGGTF